MGVDEQEEDGGREVVNSINFPAAQVEEMGQRWWLYGTHSIRIFVFGNGRIMLLDTFCPLSLSISVYTGKDDAEVRKFRDYWNNVEEMCHFCSILGVNKWTVKCHVTRGGEDRAKGLRTGVLWNNL